MAQTRTQQTQRRDINPKDQFGRKWSMAIELATGDPCGGIFPAGWTDPLRTPMKYLAVPRNEEGQAEIGRLRVDFDTWTAEHEDEERRWYQQLHANARDVYKRLDPTEVARLEQDKFLLDLTGPKPWPSPAVIRAAKNGDRQYLGLEPLDVAHRVALGRETIEDLKAGIPAPAPEPVAADTTLPPEKYSDFMAWAFKRHPGITLKDVGEMWQAHRKHLAAA